MKGISFKLKNEYDNFLFKIFYNVPINNLTWDVVYNEIIYEDKDGKLNTSIFNEDIINGLSFRKCIEKERYYLVHADIKAFNKKTEIKDINTYEEFLNSDCEIALFCTDTVEVELYCKSKSIIEKIIKNCMEFHFDDLEILTNKNDARIRFSVL